MKTFKIKKKEFGDLTSLYERIGCTHKDRYAFPYHTFVSPKTYKLIEKTIKQQYKKEYPHLNKRRLDSSVGMHLLNLGPVILTGLHDNVILVDTKSIDESKENLDNALSTNGGNNDKASA